MTCSFCKKDKETQPYFMSSINDAGQIVQSTRNICKECFIFESMMYSYENPPEFKERILFPIE